MTKTARWRRGSLAEPRALAGEFAIFFTQILKSITSKQAESHARLLPNFHLLFETLDV